MKYLFFVILVFCAAGLFSAPLERGFTQAPGVSASSEEREHAFSQARTKVIEAAAKYESTPYRYGGITAGGMDCSGFIFTSFRDALGVSLPRSSTGLYTWAEKIPLDKAQPGDLLFFKTGTNGGISHVALYLGDGRFIHSASAGPRTGVIYSTLNEQYWSRTFAAAGRAFPEASPGFRPVLASSTPAAGTAAEVRTGASRSDAAGSDTSASGGWGGARSNLPAGTGASSAEDGRLLLGVAIAPTWVGFLKGGDLLRGFASQLRLGAETYTFGTRMIFGLEVRPEYDGALGVFRLPITFSWGPSDKIMIFAGPVLSFGDASISTENGERHYSGGTSWLGAIGFTAAPFIFNTTYGEFAPYLETAWQYYYSDNKTRNANSDFSAGFRFSTGLRWTVHVR